jgi:hypothetical protein
VGDTDRGTEDRDRRCRSVGPVRPVGYGKCCRLPDTGWRVDRPMGRAPLRAERHGSASLEGARQAFPVMFARRGPRPPGLGAVGLNLHRSRPSRSESLSAALRLSDRRWRRFSTFGFQLCPSGSASLEDARQAFPVMFARRRPRPPGLAGERIGGRGQHRGTATDGARWMAPASVGRGMVESAVESTETLAPNSFTHLLIHSFTDLPPYLVE